MFAFASFVTAVGTRTRHTSPIEIVMSSLCIEETSVVRALWSF
jgi:hypothetical protein